MLRGQIGRLVVLVDGLDEAENVADLSRLLNLYAPARPHASYEGLPIPADWYRTDTWWPEDARDDERLTKPWSPLTPSESVSLASLRFVYAEPGEAWPDGRSMSEQYPVDRYREAVNLERAREALRRILSVLIATLSLVLIRVLAALSRHINTTALVLLLIAACRRFGHRDEPGDDDSLLARRNQSLPGRVLAA